ncbi:MAG TPA: Uma2 family endonuclease [Trueperaceae bacterium]|nr:Uma2 family endonuclease [Trueperaceae bacterium]
MTVAAFLARQRSGALHEGPRAELVDGKVVAGAPLDPGEASALVNLTKAFAQAGLGDLGVEVLTWAPLRLGPIDLVRAAVVLLPGPAYVEERPDDAPTVGRGRDVGAGIGGSYDPASSLLLVETVRPGRDQHERLARYAAAGAREVWLLDVRRGWIESFRSPWRREYRSRTLWYPGESVPLSSVHSVAVEALLPP